MGHGREMVRALIARVKDVLIVPRTNFLGFTDWRHPMTTRSRIRSLFASRVPRTIRKASTRRRLAVEALEERTLLSTFTVTSTLDDGSVGTLRWAVGQANSTGGAETIAFDQKVFKTPRTITLSGTQLELSDTSGTETITGPKAGVTVSGGGLSRVFQVDGGVTASISRLTITGGSAGLGGGVWNDGGTAALTNCTVSGNSASFAGGLYNFYGTVTLTNCTVS
jgi:hypothetical protein